MNLVLNCFSISSIKYFQITLKNNNLPTTTEEHNEKCQILGICISPNFIITIDEHIRYYVLYNFAPMLL